MAASPAKIFEALGDPIRRHLLELLAAGEQPAGALVAAVQQHTAISQPGVSQHLKTLRAAGLVTVRAEGTRRLYALDPTGLDTARTWLTTLLDPLHPFTQPLDPPATEVARGKRTRRTSPDSETTARGA